MFLEIGRSKKSFEILEDLIENKKYTIDAILNKKIEYNLEYDFEFNEIKFAYSGNSSNQIKINIVQNYMINSIC